jgi:hypothetical protein
LEAGFGYKVPTLVGSNLDQEKAFILMDRKYHNMDEEGLQRALSNFVNDIALPPPKHQIFMSRYL